LNALPAADNLRVPAPWPSGKAADCKSAIRRFDSDRRLSVSDSACADPRFTGCHIFTNLILLLQQAPEPVTLGRMGREYADFLSYFAVYGALGFHFQVLKSLRSAERDGEAGAVEWADRKAAIVGLFGALLMGLAMLAGLAGQASRKQTSIIDAIVAGDERQAFQIACVVVLALCFAVATRSSRMAWLVAGATAIGLVLRNIVSGRWTSMVNLLHDRMCNNVMLIQLDS
jgi:hypothetical protein